jgi:hypothetical protein
LLSTLAAFAQSGAGLIQGTIQDVTGAALPGSTVQVLNKSTGVTISSTSNNVGFYSVPVTDCRPARQWFNGYIAPPQINNGVNGLPAGAHTYWKTTLLGTFNYITDLSLYKVFNITDRYKFRINVDAFNALNIQGYVNPNPLDGIQQLNQSFWTPRQIQFSGRFTF